MDDILLIRHFLSSCGVGSRDVNLIAEMLFTVDQMVRVDENQLRRLSWVTKSGETRTLLDERKIAKILTELNTLLLGVSDNNKQGQFRQRIFNEVQKLELVEFLSVFIRVELAAQVAATIGSLDKLVDLYKTNHLGSALLIDKASLEKIEKVLARVLKETEPIGILRQVQNDRRGLGLILANILYANQYISDYDGFDLRQFLLVLEPLATLESWETSAKSYENALSVGIGNVNYKQPEMTKILRRVHSIFTHGLTPEERQVLFIFSNAARKVLTESVPKFLLDAIKSTHPFLLRPLFRSYPNALTYAVGGKVASSLETTWGDVGEDLYLAMSPALRSVRNGGIDVVNKREAFDIKSGPAIMNNDQISILHIKQKMIQQEKKVPSLDTFKVALVYGKESEAFGTMVKDVQSGNILPARIAWERLTGDPLAPERVYCLAGLLADIVGVADIIEAATSAADNLTPPGLPSALEKDPTIYDKEFQEIFDSAFDPPLSRPKASLDRLIVIEEARTFVRNLI